jgi:hypothetical protein
MILHSLRNSLAALLIVCVMAPGFYLGMAPVPEADADLKQIFGGAVGAMAACVITNLIVAAATHVIGEFITKALLYSVPTNEQNVGLKMDTWVSSAANTMEVFKECILDALAWAAKMIIYETILRAIFAWINQGFDGGPAFLSNPNEFFKKIANATVDAFINNSGLDALLCEPFSATVVDHMKTISISVETEEYACTLDSIMTGDVATEYNNMVQNGSVDTEGISGAMSLSLAGNNAYSATFAVEAEANSRIQQAQGTEKMLLDFGDGHFSLRCDLNNDGVREVCTPGDFVAKQINEWMGGGLGQLEKADEVSEVVAAAVSMLVQKVLFDTDEGLLSGFIADTSGTWKEYEYGGPQAEEAYTGSTPGAPGSPGGPVPGNANGDEPPGTCGSVYDAYGTRNGGRMAWRVSKGGESFSGDVKVTFSDGHTVTVPNSLKNYREGDGFVYKPGISDGGHGSDSTSTSHGGIYIHAPYGNYSSKVRLCD